MKRMIAMALAGVMAFAAAGGAVAAEHEVLMLNKGAKGAMVFEPDFVRAEPGDTIRFVPTDKSHNAETIKGMLPEGATAFKGKINEEIVLTVDAEGLYGIKCTPHFGMGMVMGVLVGEPVNLEEAKAVKVPAKPRAVFEAIYAEIGG